MNESAGTGRRRAAAVLLADGPFRLAWAAGALAGVMRWLEMVAVGIFVIRETGSPMAVALILFLRQVPMLLLGAFAGALSERADRRVIMLAAHAFMAAVMTVLAILALSGALTMWQVGIGVFCSGIFWSLDFPVRRTMLGDVAGTPRLAAAIALDSSTANLTRMLGPLIGGLAMEGVGIAGAYLVGTVCFGGGAVLLLFVRYRRNTIASAPGRNLIGSVREGLAHLPRQPVLLGTLLATVIMNLFGFPYLNMIPVIGEQNLALDATLTGSLISTEAATAFVTALAVATLARPEHFVPLYICCGALFLACILLFSFAGTYAEAVAALLVSGIGFAGFAAMQGTLILAFAPLAMRARFMGLMAVAIGGAGPVGTLHVGLMADHFGTPTAVGIMAGEGLVCLALLVLAVPELRPWSGRTPGSGPAAPSDPGRRD